MNDPRVLSGMRHSPLADHRDEGGGPATAERLPRRRRALLVVVLLTVLLAAGAGAGYLWLSPEPGPSEPEPGAVVAVEPLSVNLQDGHYLRLGFTIQLTSTAKEIPGARALDIAIALFSGRTMAEVNDSAQRTALKDELTLRLDEAYGGEVIEVYLTDYVTQ